MPSSVLSNGSTVNAGALKSTVVATTQAEGIAGSLEQIGDLSGNIEKRLRSVVREIDDINLQTSILSLNAQIEAAHAGAAGRSFEVVAKEMSALSLRTSESARTLDRETKSDIDQLNAMIVEVGGRVRGTRLSDLAFTNIDLIDRNLYERSCDVRWWASDSICVDAITDAAKSEEACRRLGVILDSYTVYYDIVLCDLAGRIIANGRPQKFQCIGSNQSATEWFRTAQATRSGSEFGFQGLHRSPTLAGNQMILAYSAMVREGGQTSGKPIGCLGIIFNWEALAQTIVTRTQLGEAERKQTRVCIVDQAGRLIADNQGRHLETRFPLSDFTALIACKKGYSIQPVNGKPHLVAYAYSPGFETYATGWHSFILQPLDMI
jgi:hypothetical protein